jgi:osmoprotectant transport system substrate-binding protein
MKRSYIIVAAVAGLTLSLTACSKDNKTTASASPSASTSAGSITIGSAAFPENEILADIYAGALTAKGVKVTKKLNIGERPVYMAALKDGSIDFIPEYSGSILVYLDSKATAKTPDEVFAALKTLAAAQNLTALTYAPAQDSDTITVTQATATKYNLKSIADLSAVASKLTFGAPAQFQTRADGLPALKSVYNVVFGKFTVLSAGGALTVTALKNGTVDGADIFSTDPAIAANNFISLEDTKSMFAAQNIVPLVSSAKLSTTITDAANAVSAKLDTKTLASLVAKVQVDKQDPDAVAKAWLVSVGLG